ncbi:hypothetical protein ABPG77_011100 [Micractinium sp. CCAP 211/92]
MSADDQTAVPAPERSFFEEISGTLAAPWEIGKAQPVIAGLASEGALLLTAVPHCRCLWRLACAAAVMPGNLYAHFIRIELPKRPRPCLSRQPAQRPLLLHAGDGVFDGKSVLDVGCCIGDNSIHIAKHAKGATVTGCDLVERALGVARSKAAEAGVKVEFVQQDLLLPPQGALQGRQFDVILDSAVYHVFRGSKDRQDYVHTLGQLVKPGGRIVMLVFSDKQPGDQGPMRISKEDIHGSYPPPSWTVERIDDATYETVPTKYDGKAQAYLAFIRKNE